MDLLDRMLECGSTFRLLLFTATMIVLIGLLTATPLAAQQPDFQDALLDHLAGRWILRGDIGGAETTHDIIAEWVLGHQYFRLHEVSRETTADDEPEYEAIVFIGWDRSMGQYACLWLDSTGGDGLMAEATGHAKRSSNRLAFEFKAGEGNMFYTTFEYDQDDDSWRLDMDWEQGGDRQVFARTRLTRQ